MTTEWKRMLGARGIKVWVSDKVANNARGIVLDAAIERILEYRSASLRLFTEGNLEAAYWAAQAMQDRAIEIDCAVAERTATVAGRKLVAKAEEANQAKKEAANSEHADWQRQAELLWGKPQYKNKFATDIAKLIDKKRWNTVRRHIKKPS